MMMMGRVNGAGCQAIWRLTNWVFVMGDRSPDLKPGGNTGLMFFAWPIWRWSMMIYPSFEPQLWWLWRAQENARIMPLECLGNSSLMLWPSSIWSSLNQKFWAANLDVQSVTLEMVSWQPFRLIPSAPYSHDLPMIFPWHSHDIPMIFSSHHLIHSSAEAAPTASLPKSASCCATADAERTHRLFIQVSPFGLLKAFLVCCAGCFSGHWKRHPLFRVILKGGMIGMAPKKNWPMAIQCWNIWSWCVPWSMFGKIPTL